MLSAHPFRTLCFAGAMPSVMTVSDGFLYLALQRRIDFHVTFVPLLFVGTALSYFCSPFRWPAADRIGRAPVFLGGYVLLLLTYTALVVPDPVHCGPVLPPAPRRVLRGHRWRPDPPPLSTVLPVELQTPGLRCCSNDHDPGGARRSGLPVRGALDGGSGSKRRSSVLYRECRRVAVSPRSSHSRGSMCPGDQYEVANAAVIDESFREAGAYRRDLRRRLRDRLRRTAPVHRVSGERAIRSTRKRRSSPTGSVFPSTAAAIPGPRRRSAATGGFSGPGTST